MLTDPIADQELVVTELRSTSSCTGKAFGFREVWFKC
jgi:hypothetical protein